MKSNCRSRSVVTCAAMLIVSVLSGGCENNPRAASLPEDGGGDGSSGSDAGADTGADTGGTGGDAGVEAEAG